MILDTNAVSALADGSIALEKALSGVDVLSLPVIVLGEFRFGILGSRHRTRYEAWLGELVEACTILSIDAETAQHYATIRHVLKSRGHPIPSNDVWIAALSLEHRMPVVSRDAHFDEVPGIRRVAW